MLAHNVETVPRIFRTIRPAFDYDRSLGVLTAARDAGLVTKSNLILGLGEDDEEVDQALSDLISAGAEDYSAASATVSAMRAPRAPIGFCGPRVVSRAVCRSISALSSAPTRTT